MMMNHNHHYSIHNKKNCASNNSRNITTDELIVRKVQRLHILPNHSKFENIKIIKNNGIHNNNKTNNNFKNSNNNCNNSDNKHDNNISKMNQTSNKNKNNNNNNDNETDNISNKNKTSLSHYAESSSLALNSTRFKSYSLTNLFLKEDSVSYDITTTTAPSLSSDFIFNMEEIKNQNFDKDNQDCDYDKQIDDDIQQHQYQKQYHHHNHSSCSLNAEAFSESDNEHIITDDTSENKNTKINDYHCSNNNNVVRFHTIQTRYYNFVIDVNPGCSNGVPIGIGWEYDINNDEIVNVDEYELQKQQQQQTQLYHNKSAATSTASSTSHVETKKNSSGCTINNIEQQQEEQQQNKLRLSKQKRYQLARNNGYSRDGIRENIKVAQTIKEQRNQTYQRYKQIQRRKQLIEKFIMKLKHIILRVNRSHGGH